MTTVMDANALVAPHQLSSDSAFGSFDADADQQHSTMVDPQLAMPMHSYDADDDRPNDQFNFNESIWDLPVDEADGFAAFFGAIDPSDQYYDHLGMLMGNAGDVDMADTATTASVETVDSLLRPSESLNSSQSSAISTSSNSSDEQRRVRKPSAKLKQQLEQQQQQQLEQQRIEPQSQQYQQVQESLQLPPSPKTPAKVAKSARLTRGARQARTAKVTRPMRVQSEELEPDDPKRSKFLERNRKAASKCREKKKQWMQDLEDARADLEKRHRLLQADFSALVEEVSQLKNQLMVHSGCHDANIDKWIEREARRFVHGSKPPQVNTKGQRLTPESNNCSPVEDIFNGKSPFLLPPACLQRDSRN
jgi:hypothetical protein